MSKAKLAPDEKKRNYTFTVRPKDLEYLRGVVRAAEMLENGDRAKALEFIHDLQEARRKANEIEELKAKLEMLKEV